MSDGKPFDAKEMRDSYIRMMDDVRPDCSAILECTGKYLASLSHLERNCIGLNLLLGDDQTTEVMVILTPEDAMQVAEGMLATIQRLKERQQ